MARKNKKAENSDFRTAFLIFLILSVIWIWVLVSQNNEIKALEQESARLTAEINEMLPLESEEEIEPWNELFRARNEVDRRITWYQNHHQWRDIGMTVVFCLGTFFSGVAWLNTALRGKSRDSNR